MKKIFKISLIVALGAMIFSTSCKVDEVPTFSGQRALFFGIHEYYGWVALDSAIVSSFLLPGEVEHISEFPVNLIGDALDSPAEYRMVVVDSLTDKDALQYIEVPEFPVFGAGVFTDVLKVKVKVGLIPEGFEGAASYAIVENKNFREGYFDMKTIRVYVNNIPSRPEWWDREIVDGWLGEYTNKKFSEFIKATGYTSIEGLEPTELYELCLIFRAYIKENDILDEDGYPMEIPAGYDIE